jgi:Armadillo/beta-catenin-like repeat
VRHRRSIDENKVGVASAGGISILLRAMGSPVVMVQKNATAALRELAINGTVRCM